MKEISCEQVQTLLTFFIENKLSCKLSAIVEYHLNTCSYCKEKYLQLTKLLENYDKTNLNLTYYDKDENENKVKIGCNKTFKENLSAYIDNELNDNDNLKIKKFAIGNPDARKELENILYIRQLLQDSFSKVKSGIKKDFAEDTLKQLCETDNKHEICDFSSNKYLLIIFSVTLLTTLLVIAILATH